MAMNEDYELLQPDLADDYVDAMKGHPIREKVIGQEDIEWLNIAFGLATCQTNNAFEFFLSLV